MLLPWLTRVVSIYDPTLPNDDDIQYAMSVSQADDSSLSGVYVIPPIIVSDEED
jgi:hypothetical protein